MHVSPQCLSLCTHYWSLFVLGTVYFEYWYYSLSIYYVRGLQTLCEWEASISAVLPPARGKTPLTSTHSTSWYYWDYHWRTRCLSLNRLPAQPLNRQPTQPPYLLCARACSGMCAWYGVCVSVLSGYADYHAV